MTVARTGPSDHRGKVRAGPLRNLEMAMILADAVTLRRVFVCPDKTVTMFMTPYASACVAASLDYFRRCGLASGSLAEYEARLWRSRQSIKILDERGVAPKDRLARFGRIVAAHGREFVERHRGILGPVKRFFQTDLGLYFHGDHLVGTTHHLTNHFGFDDARVDAMGRIPLGADKAEHREFGRLTGKYLADVLEMFGQNISPQARTLPTIHSRDVKSRRFYGRLVVGRQGHGAAMALASALATANLACITLPAILSSKDNFESAFQAKWTIVALFHAKSAVEIVLGQHHRDAVLRPAIANALVALQRQLRSFGEQRALRNVLMHYAIDDVDLGDDNTFTNLVQVLSRQPYGTFRADVDDALANLAGTLERCMFSDASP